ncbi:MAG: response regulator [Phycisphaeraceae bacterium]
MSGLLRVVCLDRCATDVRRLRACLPVFRDRRVSVTHVDAVHDVVDRLTRLHADVLFIDEDLPSVTGVETICALRSAGEHRPIVATTPTDCGYLAADLMRAGADGYLAKRDLHRELVEGVLDRALHTARSRRAHDRLRRNAVRQMIAERGHAAMGLT